MGRIELIIGCMFSGKTTALIERVRAAERAGRRVAVIKHRIDDRYRQDCVVTHESRHAGIAARAVGGSSELVEAAGPADFVAVDEGHFFDDGLAEECRRLAARGADVVVTALDRNIWGEPFESVRAVAAAADRVERLLAICARCGRPADHTQRTRPMADAHDFVGGGESYEPRCTECFVPGPPAATGSAERAR
jgi:thymidine kinase